MVLTHQALSKDERNIRRLIEGIGHSVQEAFQRASDAFMEHDLQLAEQVIDDDAVINELCARIEQECFVTIALRQPVAGDLRGILADMHVGQEFERIGDYAADIARNVRMMDTLPNKSCRDNFQVMIDLCMTMLTEALELLKNPEEAAARSLAARDDKVDEEEELLVQGLIQQMRRDPDTIECCVYAITVAHKMERIADRITNIAEQSVFSSTGKTVELG